MMSLSQLIKEFGVRKFLSKESLEQMRIMYEDKMLSTVEIGKFFNLSDHTVAVRLKELGVVLQDGKEGTNYKIVR